MWGTDLRGLLVHYKDFAFTLSGTEATHSVTQHDGISTISLTSVLKTVWGEARTEAGGAIETVVEVI